METKVRIVKGAALLCAAALGGCTTTGGGSGMASLSAPVSVEAALPVAPAPVVINYGGFLGGSVGARLPEADRVAALGAADGAIASGERRTWKGAHGVFGYVVPGSSTPAAAEGAGAECRSFTATIFFAGRPQTGHGTGCREADGSWHVTS